jgi:hypothetical protein
MVVGHTIPSVFEFVRAMLNVVQRGAPKALSRENQDIAGFAANRPQIPHGF